ncbi:c-type cytochrome [Simplicispira suum]|uniref:c-type cytochrome n=1 Tax=Simplicispira suum TaxID=2109915 RepID=UPI002353AB62|nr:cytochrome c [Simplicispira suum]
MNFSTSSFKKGLLFVLVAALAGGAALLWMQTQRHSQATSTNATQAVKVPEYSMMARAGLVAFEATCARCHGSNGTGTDKGPPLLHEIYNPGHHPDGAFVSAVRQGVRRHHWNFGDMPSQPKVTDREIAEIVRYVRELQVANGIVYREHRM